MLHLAQIIIFSLDVGWKEVPIEYIPDTDYLRKILSMWSSKRICFSKPHKPGSKSCKKGELREIMYQLLTPTNNQVGSEPVAEKNQRNYAHTANGKDNF